MRGKTLLIISSTLALLMTNACGFSNSVVARLKRGDPRVCTAPEVLATLTSLLHAEALKAAGVTVTDGIDDTLTSPEVSSVEAARPVMLIQATAEHADKEVGKIECSGKLEFANVEGKQQDSVTFTILPDLSSKGVIVRSNNLDQAVEHYKSNYTAQDYKLVTGKTSIAQMKLDDKAAKKDVIYIAN